MKKLFNKINIKKILLIFLLIQPFVDLITSIFVRYYPNSITLGMVLKGLFLAFLLIYVVFKYKFKDRRLSTVFIILFVVYEICYFVLNIEIKPSSILFLEIKNSMKTLYGPIMTILLFNIFRNEKFNVKSRYISYIVIEYVMLIFLAKITGTSFNTYVGYKQGTVGWFYAGNDISILLVGLFSILYFYAIKNFNFLIILSLFLTSYILLFIGTKVSGFGLIISLMTMLILSIINYISKRNKIKLKKNLTLLVLLLIFVGVLLPISPVVKNLKMQYSRIKIDDNVSDKDKSEILDDMIYSGRAQYKEES